MFNVSIVNKSNRKVTLKPDGNFSDENRVIIVEGYPAPLTITKSLDQYGVPLIGELKVFNGKQTGLLNFCDRGEITVIINNKGVYKAVAAGGNATSGELIQPVERLKEVLYFDWVASQTPIVWVGELVSLAWTRRSDHSGTCYEVEIYRGEELIEKMDSTPYGYAHYIPVVEDLGHNLWAKISAHAPGKIPSKTVNSGKVTCVTLKM
ncbi:MAG: hypothetical protein ACI8ZM_000019 [Crocinitomix sp.]|jgi:hypothetical protein